MSVIISVNKYLVLADTYTNLPKMDELERNSLEMYLSSWNFLNSDGILTLEEDIVFDSSPERCPVFCVELNGVLTKCGLLLVLSTMSVVGGGDTPAKLFFQ